MYVKIKNKTTEDKLHRECKTLWNQVNELTWLSEKKYCRKYYSEHSNNIKKRNGKVFSHNLYIFLISLLNSLVSTFEHQLWTSWVLLLQNRVTSEYIYIYVFSQKLVTGSY